MSMMGHASMFWHMHGAAIALTAKGGCFITQQDASMCHKNLVICVTAGTWQPAARHTDRLVL